MTRPVIGSIVEGHGEDAAFPELIRRIAREKFGVEVDAWRPHRVPRDKMTGGHADLVRAIQLQAGRAALDNGTVLVLADSDDDDHSTLREDIQATADAIPGTTIAIVAVREYEAWFLAAAESLRGHRDVRDDAAYLGDPESPRGCKEALNRLMTVKYHEVRHQVAFSSLMDLDAAATGCPSFAVLIDAIGTAINRAGREG